MDRNSQLPSLALLTLLALLAAPPPAEAQPAAELYTLCSFYPQGAPCEAVYQEALKDQSAPPARSVRDAFNYYARYLKPPAQFTDADRAWLTDNQITLPDLSEANLGGLHNVINDPALAGDSAARRNAANNFISRALEAELYCGFNSCSATAPGAGPRGT